MNAINPRDMGCNFFAGSGHKWQCAPGRPDSYLGRYRSSRPFAG